MHSFSLAPLFASLWSTGATLEGSRYTTCLQEFFFVWDILHPERLANVAYHLLCGPCCYWLSSCVWVLWLWASWTHKKTGHKMDTALKLQGLKGSWHVQSTNFTWILYAFTMCCLFFPLEICLSSSRLRASFLDDIWGDICSTSGQVIGFTPKNCSRTLGANLMQIEDCCFWNV